MSDSERLAQLRQLIADAMILNDSEALAIALHSIACEFTMNPKNDEADLIFQDLVGSASKNAKD